MPNETKIIYAKDYGILAGQEVAKALNDLLVQLSYDAQPKTLVLERGDYYLDVASVPKPTLYITNTIADEEWEKDEQKHVNAVGLYFNGIENLTFDGNGSTFIAIGQMTNVAMCNSRNLTIKDVTFKASNPDMHCLTVIKKGIGYIDFALDEDSLYDCLDGEYRFVGKGYSTPFFAHRNTAWWIGKIPTGQPNVIFRTFHPLRGAYGLREIAPYVFRAKYLVPIFCKVDDRFHLYDVRRKYQGIFADKCHNIVLDGVRQNFNYGLATVFQQCENLTIVNCTFAPDKESGKKMASVADFIQVCSCRGKVEIAHNEFCGAGDDCLNVHGVHFKIVQVDGQNIIVKFMHPQTLGYCPFEEGDRLRFVSPKTLLVVGENHVAQARLIDEYTIKITLSLPIDNAVKGLVVENADACPDVLFKNNSLTRIITRGLLLTSAGKIVVEDNDFYNTSMNAILISDDANSWYESGMVRDVTIEGNRFFGNEGYYVCVKPENAVHDGFVHNGITIKSNLFASRHSKGLYFKSSGKCLVENNVFKYSKTIKRIDSDVTIKNNE